MGVLSSKPHVLTTYTAVASTRESAISSLLVQITDKYEDVRTEKVYDDLYVQTKYGHSKINVVYIVRDGQAACYRAEVHV